MLPETGSISMSQVNAELKKAETSRISLNDSDVRKLAKVESGTISMSDLRGKKASESVENYVLFNGSFDSEEEDPKGFSFSLNIPHKIISGNFIIETYKSGKYSSVSDGTNPSRLNIPGFIDYNTPIYNELIRKIIAKTNFDKQTISCNGAAGNGMKRLTSTTYYAVNTTYVTVKFTGEWEL